MKLIIGVALCLFGCSTAWADEAAQCRADDGSYLTGRVTRGPVFARGRHPLHGVRLSHTHVIVQADQDRQAYDIAIDNVFASGFDAAGDQIPTPLSTIRVGDRLEICGRRYMDDTGPGMDWVHTNCGAVPTNKKPNGWIKILGADGKPGPNLESSGEYCRLW